MSFVSAALSRWWASAGSSLEVKSLTRASGQFSFSSILASDHFFSHQEEGEAASETLPYRAESRFRASKRRVWVSRRKGITSLLKVSSTSFLGKKAAIHGTAFSRLLLHCFLISFFVVVRPTGTCLTLRRSTSVPRARTARGSVRGSTKPSPTQSADTFSLRPLKTTLVHPPPPPVPLPHLWVEHNVLILKPLRIAAGVNV